MRYFFKRASMLKRELYESMGFGIYVGLITGMWIYAIMKGTYDEFGNRTKGKDILQLAIFTGVINGFFYANALGAFSS